MTEPDLDAEAIENMKDRLDQIYRKIREKRPVFESHQIKVARYMELESRVHVRNEQGEIIRGMNEDKFHNYDKNSQILKMWVDEQKFIHEMQTFFVREEINFCCTVHEQIDEQFSVFRTLIPRHNISIDEKNHCQELFESVISDLRNLWDDAKYCQDYLRWEKIHAFGENAIARYHVANFPLLVELWLKNNATESLSRISVFENKLAYLQSLLDSTQNLISRSSSDFLHNQLQNLHRSQPSGTTRSGSNLFL